MTRPRPLGIEQRGVLRALVQHKRYSHGYCGWVWSTPSKTERVLESLVRRGLAERLTATLATTGHTYAKWVPTQAGIDLVTAEGRR